MYNSLYLPTDGKPIYLYKMLPKTSVLNLAPQYWDVFFSCGKGHTTWDLPS